MEFAMLYEIQEMHTAFLDRLMVFITTLGNGGIFWVVLSGILLCFRKTRKCGALMLLTMLICYLTGNLWMKNAVQRQRPCWLDQSVSLLIPVPKDFSFPSGHTLHGFGAATMVFLHFKKAGVAALLLAAAIAFSRLYLFVHFPTDILGGLLLGGAVALAVYFTAGKIAGKAVQSV